MPTLNAGVSVIANSVHSTLPGIRPEITQSRSTLDQINGARGREERRDLWTHGGELRRRRRVQSVVGRRELVEEGRHVHLLNTMETLDAIQGPDLRAQPAHHEVLEDPRRRSHLRRRNQRSPASREVSSVQRMAPASPYAVGSLRARAGGGREAVKRNRKPDGGCRLAVQEEGDDVRRVGSLSVLLPVKDSEAIRSFSSLLCLLFHPFYFY